MFISNKKTRNKINIRLIALVIVALLALCAFGGFVLIKNRQNQNQTQAPDASQEVPKIDLSPPTEQDQATVDTNKGDIIQQQSATTKPPEVQTDGREVVTPIISYAGQYGQQVEIGAYVPGALEQSGVCTATLNNGGQTVSKSVTAVTNVNSMDCPAMIFQRSEFSNAGNWQLIVEYSSASSSGKSVAQKVEIK